MNQLGNGLTNSHRHEDALSVKEAEFSMLVRIGASEEDVFAVQNNLAGTYQVVGRAEEANRMLLDVYSGRLKLHGEEHGESLTAACNYAIHM